MDKKIFEIINFKQPKYMLPLILYIPLLFTGYFVIDMFNTETIETKNKELESTEYLNSNLPQAHTKEGMGSKYENMLDAYGKIQDKSAVEGIEDDRDSLTKKLEYDSKYSDEEAARLAQRTDDSKDNDVDAAMERNKSKASAVANGNTSVSGRSSSRRSSSSSSSHEETLEELRKTLEEARKGTKSIIDDAEKSASGGADEIIARRRASKSEDETESKTAKVERKKEVESSFFNTIAHNEPAAKMIKAIIDENIKAVDGSRVRLRLLDDVVINETVLPKGSYIYATMSGFGSQRVKGNVKSVMVGEDIVEVNLNVYDMDGLEGLYVPSSNFREQSKEIGSNVFNSSMTLNDNTSSNNYAQWAQQAVQNAYQRTSQAISKIIRKNKVKLKYGTHVYLMNGENNTKNKNNNKK